MGWVWNAHGLIGLPALVLAWVLAGIVYFASPQKGVAGRLALLLVAEGTAVGLAQGVSRFSADAATTRAFILLFTGITLSIVPLYLLFLATIETPITRPLAGRTATVTLVLAAIAAFLWPVVRPEDWVIATPLGPGEHPTNLPRLLYAATATFLFAFVVAITRLVRTPRGTLVRRQAKAYALAFGLHDLAWVATFLVLLPFVWPRLTPSVVNVLHPAIYTTNTILLCALLGYALLKENLFDIDLKIKRGISRGTVIAAFTAVFFVVGVVAENYLSSRFGYLVGGGAAGLLLLALAPLQRIGRGLADRMMPHVDATPAYVAFRKLEVYKAALEGAFQDGAVTPKEREMLRRLRESLGIAEPDAMALEHDLVAVGRPAVMT